tara:strand:+ start:2548 stop:2667 length:120 start_codon:yes stop_codon:yes gene_type:complete
MTDKDIYQLTIDELAILWNKTRDEKYKKAWYEKVRKVYG